MTTPPREIELLPQDIPVNVIYEDDDFVIVNKEAGMVVHPGHGNYTGTLVNALMHRFRDLPTFRTGETRPGLVHRIDKNTSGILVVAKNEIALSKLAKQFFDKTSQRTYIAIVWGTFEKNEGTIIGNIDRSPKDRMKMAVFPDGSQGKHAVTHYKVLAHYNFISIVECRLETGRTHQIRVHFEHIGHPIFNDERYSGNEIVKGLNTAKYRQFIQNCFDIMPRHALHAKSLGFVHPTTNKPVFFDSELPADFVGVIDKWKRYSQAKEEI
jgi:23S rRNA pseudouridine1911/1915/1917 synthase